MFPRTPQIDHPSGPRSRRRLATTSLVAIVALLGVGCGGSDDKADKTDNTSTTATANSDNNTVTTETANGEANGVDGVEFTSPDGDYSVTFPSEPTLQPSPVPLPNGQTIQVPLHVASTETSQYSASMITYPDDVQVSDDPGEVLDGSMAGAISNMQGAELGDSKDVEVNGKPGRRFDFSITQGMAKGHGEALFVIDGRTLYQAIAVGEVDDSDVHAGFVDSFKIL